MKIKIFTNILLLSFFLKDPVDLCELFVEKVRVKTKERMIHITAYLSFSVYLHIVKCQIKKTKGKWKYKYRGQSVLARSGCSWHTQTPTQASAGFQLRRKLCASRTARERCGSCCWNLVYYYLPYWVNDSYCDFSDSVYPVQEVILWNVVNEWEKCVGVKHTATDAFYSLTQSHSKWHPS